MKILFFVRRFYPQIGGVEKHTLEIARRLVEKGYKVIIVTENIEESYSRDKQLRNSSAKIAGEIDGIDIYRINPGEDNWFKKFRIWKEIWLLRRLIVESDIIHCHDVFFWYLPFSFLWWAKPVYITFHGYETYPVKWKAIIVRKISEILSDGNICIGDFIKKYYKTIPDYVSYGGVNLPKTIKPFKKERSVTYVGRFDKNTGFEVFLKAFDYLKDFSFIVVGDGKFRNEIKKQVEVHEFTNQTDSYRQETHFAFASGFLSIMEAMANKRLVFSVNETPIRNDYLKMSPFAEFIVIEKDPKKLAEKVEYYLKNKDKEKELVDKAYDWVKNQTWDKVTDLYIKLWNK